MTAPFSVTLITGDVVRVDPLPGGKHAIKVRRGKGRERIPMITHGTKTGLTVTPADAVPLVSAGRLDARLFDVLLLGRLGYDDRSRKDLPLMVTGKPGAAPATLTATSSVRTLPRLGVNVLREQKSQASAFWTSYTAKSRARSLPPGKLWLVGKRTPTLDVSVPQVGAPVAWNAGHTGAGVTVAVLDTGYDTRHPDLKGVVAAERDFTESQEGMRDTVGHGTHVASTIAGRGTASGGKYTGVAKGAQLAVGKVCERRSCADDAILAGMEWAAASGAKVVNLSLGGPVSEGGDPIEDGINRLTAAGMLFVVSAGNAGPGPESVSSPGTADGALTVGSVTKTDQLSDFSSRGPRVNASRRSDYAIKPDLTAPGQDIVAARAAGTSPGLPESVEYVSASGTSMAAPHVAGGAAILAAQHPDWTPGQLKAALMASAKPNAALTVYQQGTGRLDLGRAVTETVVPSAGSLSLGYFPWPNADAPTVRKTLTYTNTGKSAVTLNLGLTVHDDKGNPAPSGMFAVSPSSLAVPAGETATATVTVNPTAAPVGLYGGALTATTADGRTSVRTAVGAYQEPESYDLTVAAINRAGKPASYSLAIAINQRTGEVSHFYFHDTAVRRMPADDYTVLGMVLEEPDPENPMSDVPLMLAARSIRIGQANEVTFDARKGRQVNVSVDRADATVYGGYITSLVHDRAPDIFVATDAGNTYLEPTTARVPGVELALRTMFVKAGTGSPEQPPSPYVYNVAHVVNDHLPDPQIRLTARDFGTVKHVVSRQGLEEHWAMSSYALTPKFRMALGFYPPIAGQLRGRVDYYSARGGVTFATDLEALNLVDGVWNWSGYSFSQQRAYRAGRTVTETWNTAPLGPTFGPGGDRGPQRLGDTVQGYIPLLSDSQAGHVGFPHPWGSDTGETTLRRDGTVIRTTPRHGTLDPTVLPPGDAVYTLETSLNRPETSPQLSRRVHALWTFRSAHVPGSTPQALPLNVVRYSPRLDADNQAPAAGAFRIPVRFEAEHAALKHLAVQISYDGGTTWIPAPLTGTGNQRTATVRHPGKAGFASLRAVAVDTAGNKVEQTIINAYALA